MSMLGTPCSWKYPTSGDVKEAKKRIWVTMQVGTHGLGFRVLGKTWGDLLRDFYNK